MIGRKYVLAVVAATLLLIGVLLPVSPGRAQQDQGHANGSERTSTAVSSTETTAPSIHASSRNTLDEPTLLTTQPTTATPQRKAAAESLVVRPHACTMHHLPPPLSGAAHCPARHRALHCEGLQDSRRALVVYFLDTTVNPHDMQPELWNVNFFANFGVVAANTSMFQSVEYVMVRMLPHIESPRLHLSQANFRLVDVPMGGDCRCAQAHAIAFLGGASTVVGAFQFIVLVDSSAQGPLQEGRGDVSWIDILAMGGQDRISETTPPLLVTSMTREQDAGTGVVAFDSVLLPAQLRRVESRGCKLPSNETSDDQLLPCVWWHHVLALNVTTIVHSEGRCVVVDTSHLPQSMDGPQNSTTALLDDACSTMFIKLPPNGSDTGDELGIIKAQLTDGQMASRGYRDDTDLQKLMAKHPNPFTLHPLWHFGWFSRLGLNIPLLPRASEREVPRHRIALVFFGLVKNVDEAQLAALKEHITRPLEEMGEVEGFLHSFQTTTFANPRNGESDNDQIDQQRSIGLLNTLFQRPMRVAFDHTDAAHRFFGSTHRLLRFGGAWSAQSYLSTHYYLRQQYSLLRATELWTGVNYSTSSSSDDAQELPPSPYSCVVYIRPDLLFVSPLPRDALRAVCRSEHRGHRDVVLPAMVYGGFHDRHAFGTPEGMLLYGIRGLRLKRFVDARQVVHAETYLARFLCENNVTVHLAPWISRRLRLGGRVADDTAENQLNNYFNEQTNRWSAHANAEHSNRGWLGMMSCLALSIWGRQH